MSDLRRCQLCREVFTDSDVRGGVQCPKCGVKDFAPHDIDLDVTLSINWGDLQMLADFALREIKAGIETYTDEQRAYWERVYADLREARPIGGGPLTEYQEAVESHRTFLADNPAIAKWIEKIALEAK